MIYNSETKKTIKKLKTIKNAFDSGLITYKFIDYSLEWIKDRANDTLDERTSHFWGSEARLWNKNIYSNFGVLENQDMNSASIEFGIGLKGQMNANNSARLSDPTYVYDRPSEYKDDNGFWTFQDKRTGIWLTFNGYEGKSFLYDTFCEYMFDKIWVQIYEKVIKEVIGGICK